MMTHFDGVQQNDKSFCKNTDFLNLLCFVELASRRQVALESWEDQPGMFDLIEQFIFFSLYSLSLSVVQRTHSTVIIQYPGAQCRQNCAECVNRYHITYKQRNGNHADDV